MPPWVCFATVGLVAFVPAQFNLFLRTPEKSHGLFVLAAAVAVAATVGWSAGLHGIRAGATTPGRDRMASFVALGLGLLLAFAYSFLASLTILPFKSVAAEDAGQPGEALLPLVLPETLKELVREEGSRQSMVERHKPGGVEFELRGHEMGLFFTQAGLAILYGLVFASLGAAGGLAVRSAGVSLGIRLQEGPASSPSQAAVLPPGVVGREPVAFISHASKDLEAAALVCAYLEGAGIACWIAPRNIPPGTKWMKAIAAGIRDCPVFLVLLSAASNESEYVLREVHQALSRQKLILPLRIDEVELSEELSLGLRTIQGLKLGNPPAPATLARLRAAIEGRVPGPDATVTAGSGPHPAKVNGSGS